MLGDHDDGRVFDFSMGSTFRAIGQSPTRNALVSEIRRDCKGVPESRARCAAKWLQLHHCSRCRPTGASVLMKHASLRRAIREIWFGRDSVAARREPAPACWHRSCLVGRRPRDQEPRCHLSFCAPTNSGPLDRSSTDGPRSRRAASSSCVDHLWTPVRARGRASSLCLASSDRR